MTGEHREIPIELVNEPPAPTRQRISGDYIRELAESIKALGQLQPGGVVPNGQRFDIVFGHCRLLACREAGAEIYRAYVYDSTSEAMLGAQLHENARRAKVNPVDEAEWFAQLLDALSWDTTELAAQLSMTRAYVEGRLNLLRGDPRVLAALREKRITIGVAQRLNAYGHDGDRLVLLDAAMAGGASERLVTQWIAQRGDITAHGGELRDQPEDHILNQSVALDVPTSKCLFCGTDKHPWLMVPVWLHTPCRDIVDALLARHGGQVHERSTELATGAGAPRPSDR